jgi:hypothetical protein
MTRLQTDLQATTKVVVEADQARLREVLDDAQWRRNGLMRRLVLVRNESA